MTAYVRVSIYRVQSACLSAVTTFSPSLKPVATSNCLAEGSGGKCLSYLCHHQPQSHSRHFSCVVLLLLPMTPFKHTTNFQQRIHRISQTVFCSKYFEGGLQGPRQTMAGQSSSIKQQYLLDQVSTEFVFLDQIFPPYNDLLYFPYTLTVLNLVLIVKQAEKHKDPLRTHTK